MRCQAFDGEKVVTEKSATFSFFFFTLFGILFYWRGRWLIRFERLSIYQFDKSVPVEISNGPIQPRQQSPVWPRPFLAFYMLTSPIPKSKYYLPAAT